MIISYQGIESFKVQFGEFVIALNPISKESEHKGARFGADIVLITLNDPDMNGSEVVSGKGEPLIATGPGEYEVKGVFIKGFPTRSDYKKDGRLNTIYTISLEGMNICFLGAMNEAELSSELQQQIDGVDILFLPIGGEGVLDAHSAYKIAVKLEPKIIIPMHYGDVGEKGALDTFLKESGREKAKPEEKLTVKKKDLEGKEGEVVVLASN